MNFSKTMSAKDKAIRLREVCEILNQLESIIEDSFETLEYSDETAIEMVDKALEFYKVMNEE